MTSKSLLKFTFAAVLLAGLGFSAPVLRAQDTNNAGGGCASCCDGQQQGKKKHKKKKGDDSQAPAPSAGASTNAPAQ